MTTCFLLALAITLTASRAEAATTDIVMDAQQVTQMFAGILPASAPSAASQPAVTPNQAMTVPEDWKKPYLSYDPMESLGLDLSKWLEQQGGAAAVLARTESRLMGDEAKECLQKGGILHDVLGCVMDVEHLYDVHMGVEHSEQNQAHFTYYDKPAQPEKKDRAAVTQPEVILNIGHAICRGIGATYSPAKKSCLYGVRDRLMPDDLQKHEQELMGEMISSGRCGANGNQFMIQKATSSSTFNSKTLTTFNDRCRFGENAAGSAVPAEIHQAIGETGDFLGRHNQR
ncbi:MAG: hypothetical protein GC134_03200 [Proteobacteria bacterium]|nr:hypothetical protein [Pseudomonadota bacterium]